MTFRQQINTLPGWSWVWISLLRIERDRGGKCPVFLSRRQEFGSNSAWWIGDLVQRATHSSGTTLKQSWLVVLVPNLSIVLFQTNVVPTSCFICILLFVCVYFLSHFSFLNFSSNDFLSLFLVNGILEKKI